MGDGRCSVMATRSFRIITDTKSRTPRNRAEHSAFDKSVRQPTSSPNEKCCQVKQHKFFDANCL